MAIATRTKKGPRQGDPIDCIEILLLFD